ncbi:MAG: 4-vinyl reductase [Ardenticatenaceae bacterium]|nr:4-vinyl reductase [Ardenticatenaceae bacterium]
MSESEIGLYYPNRWPRIIMISTEEIIGEKGVAALLNLAGLPQYIRNYPPDNMKKEFPFEHVGKLQQAFWDMYGPRGARVFATRAGAKTFNDGLESFGAVAQAARAAMRIGSLEKRISIGLNFFAKFFNTVSDQKVRVEESDEEWTWNIEKCPMCTGRTATEPVCHLAVGVLQAALENFADKDRRYSVKPTHCIAMGHEEGIIVVDKKFL